MYDFKDIDFDGFMYRQKRQRLHNRNLCFYYEALSIL